MDEILGVIIDPNGMSFNDLKPIYKEFLLKLAVTLTKDELFQRSKAIMRRQKKKMLRRTSAIRTRSGHVVVCSKFKSFKHVFQRFKFGKKKKGLNNLKHLQDNRIEEPKLSESTISSSSYDTRQFRPKSSNPVARKQSYRKRNGEQKRNVELKQKKGELKKGELKKGEQKNYGEQKHKRRGDQNVKSRERASTSEESDFFSLRRSKNRQQNFDFKNQNRNSSSGYVSYSECSYDSDTCTCISADKCYCSLGQKHQKGKCKESFKRCKEEEKCYCSFQRDIDGMYYSMAKPEVFLSILNIHLLF